MAATTHSGDSVQLPLTGEDTARSRDRLHVHRARRLGRRWLVLWLLAGPGILAMLGENDGPSMIAYATDGAKYGLGHDCPGRETRPLRYRGGRGPRRSVRCGGTDRRGGATHPQRSGHPGVHGRRIPRGADARRGRRRRNRLRAGLIEAGAVAMLTISASTAYAAGECAGVSHSFNSSPRNAAVFYAANIGIALLAAMVILVPGAPLLSIALNANVLATVLLPVSLAFMLMLANDTALMGPWANRRSTNAIGSTVIAFVGLCGVAYGIDSFLQATHLIGS